MWPPNSPGLNPYDYNAGSSLEKRVFRGGKVQMLKTLNTESSGVGGIFRKEGINNAI